MPDPNLKQLQALVGSEQFQSLSPQDQLANFRTYLSDTDEEFRGMDAIGQSRAASQILDHYRPGFLSKVADVAEYVPVVGGAVRGARNDEVRPLTGAIFGQPESTAGRVAAEVGRDVLELGAAEGVTRLAAPAIDAIAGKVAGGTVEDVVAGWLGKQGASSLAEGAINATTGAAARRFAGEAARVALRERAVKYGLEQLPAAALFTASTALEGEIANGELPPLSDLLATGAGAAALGLGFRAGGELLQKFGLRSMDEIVGTAAKFDPERFATAQRNISEIASAVRKASGNRMSPTEAADFTLDALTKPVTEVGDQQLLKAAIRENPQLLGSETGLRILQTQRAPLLSPDITVLPALRVEGTTYERNPSLRVSYEDATGNRVVEDLSTPAAQKQFRSKLAGGNLIVESAMGDEASVVRAGLRDASLIERRVAPGGGPQQLVPEQGPSWEEFTRRPNQLPAIRQPSLAEMAARELRRGGPLDTPNLLDTVGFRREAAPVAGFAHAESPTSVEAITRLAREKGSGITYAAVDVRGKGRERVIPATVDRVDAKPGPYEIIVKRGSTPKDVIVEAGAKVTPAQVQRVRAAEQQKYNIAVASQPRPDLVPENMARTARTPTRRGPDNGVLSEHTTRLNDGTAVRLTLETHTGNGPGDNWATVVAYAPDGSTIGELASMQKSDGRVGPADQYVSEAYRRKGLATKMHALTKAGLGEIYDPQHPSAAYTPDGEALRSSLTPEGIARRAARQSQRDRLALPAPDVQHGVLQPSGERVFLEPIKTPPVDAVVKSTSGLDVTVKGEGDAIGRALIQLPDGSLAKTQWNPRERGFEVPETLLTLPERRASAPALTSEVPVISNEFRAQVVPGQVIHQSVSDLGKRGARDSIEVLGVDGDTVLLRSGELVRTASLQQLADTIESGAGRFGFDMTKAPQDQIDALGARFAGRVRDGKFDVPTLSPEQAAKDAQLATDLYTFNKKVGLGAAPGTAGADPNVGLRAREKANRNRPANEKTRGGSALVKGCKPK